MKREEGDAQLETFVADVVPVVDHLFVVHGHEHTTSHGGDEDGLVPKVDAGDGNMGENDGGESLEGLFPGWPFGTDHLAVDLHSGTYPFQCLVASEDAKLGSLFQACGESGFVDVGVASGDQKDLLV